MPDVREVGRRGGRPMLRRNRSDRLEEVEVGLQPPLALASGAGDRRTLTRDGGVRAADRRRNNHIGRKPPLGRNEQRQRLS